ncbi:hypothetical protein AB205_0179820, partial [Aquarana catesbeiana]
LKCREKWSLNGLVKHLFSKQLLKDNSVRCSSWDKFPLTDEQRLYAASDAYASLLTYQKIENMEERERDLFHVSAEDGSASLEMKDKLKALSQECLDLVDQVPYDFEIGGKAQRAADILAKLSESLEDVRSILAEASKAQEDFKELSIEDLENSPEYDTGKKSFSTNSKYLNNVVDDEEDEGIEEEIEEDWGKLFQI